MKKDEITIVDFLKLILDALKETNVDYIIGGAIAEWAWGEPRATQDVDIVINLPIKSINQFSKELEKRNILVPADIILNAMIEDRADTPLSAIHMYSGIKADLYLTRVATHNLLPRISLICTDFFESISENPRNSWLKKPFAATFEKNLTKVAT